MTRLGLSHALVLVVAAGLSVSCKEKMGVEKRAEEIAAEKASASAAAAASASAPDPKEERYAKAVKTVRERAVAHMAALQKIYETSSDADVKAFRDWFPPTKEGQKEADDLSKEAAFAGKEGMSIKKFEVQDVNFDEKLEKGTTDVYVEESQRGKARCTIYKIDWNEIGGSWRRVARRDFRIIPCN